MAKVYRAQAVFPRGRATEWVEGWLMAPVTSGVDNVMLDVGVEGDARLVYTSTLELVHEAAREPEATPRGKILREAEGLITGDRNKNYGSPTENFDTTAALWNAQLGHKLKPGQVFTATDVALLMVQLKMARLKTSTSKRDHYLDIAGYIACGWECQEAEDSSA